MEEIHPEFGAYQEALSINKGLSSPEHTHSKTKILQSPHELCEDCQCSECQSKALAKNQERNNGYVLEISESARLARSKNSEKHSKSSPKNNSRRDHELSNAEKQEIARLQKRDAEVRAHESAHKAAAGSLGGSIHLEYETGPDGKRYAVEGSVPIETSEGRTPEETLQKAKIIKRAALAPAEPSAADRQIAAKASQLEQKARQEITREYVEESQNRTQDFAAHDLSDGTYRFHAGTLQKQTISFTNQFTRIG